MKELSELHKNLERQFSELLSKINEQEYFTKEIETNKNQTRIGAGAEEFSGWDEGWNLVFCDNMDGPKEYYAK